MADLHTHQSTAAETSLIPVVGLMSGTSADGIDAALVYTDGRTLEPTGIAQTVPYRQQTVDDIWQVVHDPSLLAARSLNELPLTFPGTTGVQVPLCGGKLARAQ